MKDAEAVKRGAIGTISFTSPDDPRFRWDVSVATSKQGSFAWVDAKGQPSRGDAALRGSASLNHSGVAALFAGAPTPLAEVFAAAAASRPQAFDLKTRISMATSSTRKDIESANLVGRVTGSDPQLRNEHVVYIAHVDHFGRGVAMNGDDIYNGAHDNASGVAVVLEIAHAAVTLPTRSRRSALFLFVTAEERGLLGSDYFARHPTVPRDSLVADLTLDMPFLFHPLLDIVPYGAQHSTLMAPVSKAAQHLGIGLAEDPIPEQVLFIRSDHYSFVRQGIPSLFIKSGFKTGDPRGWRATQRRVSPRRVSQAERRHDAGIRLRGRRRACAAQLPDRLAGGAGNRAAGVEPWRFLRAAIRRAGALASRYGVQVRATIVRADTSTRLPSYDAVSARAGRLVSRVLGSAICCATDAPVDGCGAIVPAMRTR